MGGEELNFIQEAFESNYIAPLGPMVEAFEKEFAEKVGIGNALTCGEWDSGWLTALFCYHIMCPKRTHYGPQI